MMCIDLQVFTKVLEVQVHARKMGQVSTRQASSIPRSKMDPVAKPHENSKVTQLEGISAGDQLSGEHPSTGKKQNQVAMMETNSTTLFMVSRSASVFPVPFIDMKTISRYSPLLHSLESILRN